MEESGVAALLLLAVAGCASAPASGTPQPTATSVATTLASPDAAMITTMVESAETNSTSTPNEASPIPSTSGEERTVPTAPEPEWAAALPGAVAVHGDAVHVYVTAREAETFTLTALGRLSGEQVWIVGMEDVRASKVLTMTETGPVVSTCDIDACAVTGLRRSDGVQLWTYAVIGELVVHEDVLVDRIFDPDAPGPFDDFLTIVDLDSGDSRTLQGSAIYYRDSSVYHYESSDESGTSHAEVLDQATGETIAELDFDAPWASIEWIGDRWIVNSDGNLFQVAADGSEIGRASSPFSQLLEVERGVGDAYQLSGFAATSGLAVAGFRLRTDPDAIEQVWMEDGTGAGVQWFGERALVAVTSAEGARLIDVSTGEPVVAASPTEILLADGSIALVGTFSGDQWSGVAFALPSGQRLWELATDGRPTPVGGGVVTMDFDGNVTYYATP